MSARIGLLLTAIILAAPASASKWTERVFADATHTHAATAMIRIVPSDGPARVESFDGIGCSEAICSREFIRALVLDDEGTTVQSIRFDRIARIEMRGGGEALFRFTDGIVQRLLVAADNRVLYLRDGTGRTKKIDLDKVVSIEFSR